MIRTRGVQQSILHDLPSPPFGDGASFYASFVGEDPGIRTRIFIWLRSSCGAGPIWPSLDCHGRHPAGQASPEKYRT
eukprot:scaffold679264_cov60-Prasinocladus_malaysianus.AAC.1